MPRILQVCNTDFYLSRFLVPLVVELSARGHQVECVCEGSDVDPRIEKSGVRVHHFEFPKRSSPLAFWHAVQRMRTILRRGDYDCVNSHNRNASLIARIGAWLEQVPLNLYTAHGFYFHDGQKALAREATILLEAVLARITHFTLSQSAEDISFVTRRGLVAKDRIAHIGNGIDTERFRPRFDRTILEEKLNLAATRYRIATTGRIVKGKGVEDLLKAFAALAKDHPEIQLVIIGGSIVQDIEPFELEIRRQIDAYDLGNRVNLTGIVNNVPEYLATADVFVLPSYREGMPRSLIEAMSMGIACIATDIRGCREVIENGFNGLTYQAGDVDALYTLLKRWLQDPLERASMAKRARESAVRQFSESGYIARQVAAIEHLLAERSFQTAR